MAPPQRLIVPRIGVNAAIEYVGQDARGAMDVPKRVENVAWYQLGPRPGATGNAVISGHLDDYRQQPAVFWELRNLQEGDEVVVQDSAGVQHRFQVVYNRVYAEDQAPLDVIFGDLSVRPNLYLITCNGVWDAAQQNYDERRVVFAIPLGSQ